MRTWAALRALILALVLGAAALAVWAPALWAQETAAQDETAVDYDEWETTAERAEAELERRGISDERLEELRGQLAGWRAALLTAQNANSARIATVKEQIAALGPAPAEGETEAEEISSRRKELADRLVTLQAPGIAAIEAYRATLMSKMEAGSVAELAQMAASLLLHKGKPSSGGG